MNPSFPSHYTVNQARSIIRSSDERERVKFFQGHPSPLVQRTALHRLVHGRPFTRAIDHAHFNQAADIPVNPDILPPVLTRLNQVGTLKTPVVMELATRYGFPIEVVQATLEAKGGDEKAAARSLSAKKARAAQSKKA